MYTLGNSLISFSKSIQVSSSILFNPQTPPAFDMDILLDLFEKSQIVGGKTPKLLLGGLEGD